MDFTGKITTEQLHELLQVRFHAVFTPFHAVFMLKNSVYFSLQTFNLGMNQSQYGEILGHLDVIEGQISIADFYSYFVEQQAEVGILFLKLIV